MSTASAGEPTFSRLVPTVTGDHAVSSAIRRVTAARTQLATRRYGLGDGAVGVGYGAGIIWRFGRTRLPLCQRWADRRSLAVPGDGVRQVHREWCFSARPVTTWRWATTRGPISTMGGSWPLFLGMWVAMMAAMMFPAAASMILMYSRMRRSDLRR